MKKLILILPLLFLLTNLSHAQFDDLLKKVTTKVAKVDLLEDKNVTTSIDDALPVAYWLKDLDSELDPVEPEVYDFNLAPGYYRFSVQSYCLKAGTYGPSKGSGYLMSPLLGKRSETVFNIVQNSVLHPEIEQHDIQVLLWGIIYNEKFTDFPLDFQNRVRPLLTPAEIADLTLDLKNVPLDVMPDDIKKIANYYKDLRANISNPNLAYQDLERSTMLNGYLPDEPFSKYVQKGLWAYVGDGFYVRSLPIAYPHSIIEVFRPAKVTVTRDEKNRISAMEYDGSRMEIAYNDEQGADVINFTQGNYPIWRIKTITLHGSNAGEELVLDNPGWIVKDKGQPIKTTGGSSIIFRSEGDPVFGQYKARVDKANNQLKDFDQYMKEKKMSKNNKSDDEKWADDQIHDGLKAALNPEDKKGQESWIRKHIDMVKHWWADATSALAGEDSKDNGKTKIDLPHHVAVPATNGNQRLIPSGRKFTE